MPRCQHQFVVEITGPKGEPLGQHRISPEWGAAVNCLRFESLRLGNGQTFIPEKEVCVEPRWSAAGKPHMDGVILSAHGCEAELPNRYFKSAAALVACRLVDEKKLENGDLYTYNLLAYAQGEPPAAPRGKFSFEEEPSRVEITDMPLDILLEHATLRGEADDELLSVFVAEQVLGEIEAQAVQAGMVETGGVLIGHLYRGAKPKKLAAEITAQIPISDMKATSMSLSFTDETWMAVRRAVQLRNRDEILLGWQHSHPAKHWCPETCTMDQRLKCSRQLPFFSEDDVRLHGVVFPAGWQIGLLANHADSGLTVSCFGWGHGVIRQRPYHILNANAPTHVHAASIPPNPQTQEHHA